MPTCSATITGPHTPDGSIVYCTRDVGHDGNHAGLATDGHGETHWTDHHAGATPHDPTLRYSDEPPVDNTPTTDDTTYFPPL